MLTLLIDLLLCVLLFKKKTPVALVIGICALALIVLVVTVVTQAAYVK